MTEAQAVSVLDVLSAAFPSKAKRIEARTLYGSLLADLDYDLMSKAVKTVIEESSFWPKWAELRRAYNSHAAAVRREAEQQELDALLAEPTDEERRQQLERIRGWMTARWPQP